MGALLHSQFGFEQAGYQDMDLGGHQASKQIRPEPHDLLYTWTR